MEQKIVTTNANNEKFVLDKHLLFKWQCVQKKYIGGHVEIEFTRDDSLPYIDELRKLENEFGEYRIPTMLPTFIFPIISIILFTVFLILFFTHRENFNFILFFLTLLLPAIICLVLAVLVMLLRARTINKIEVEKPKKEEEYKEKIAKLG